MMMMEGEILCYLLGKSIADDGHERKIGNPTNAE
jgi:hypothetical protein